MLTAKSNWTIRTGLFLTALSWFMFTFYEFTNALLHNFHPSNENPQWSWLLFQETGGAIGLGLRAASGLIAVIVSLFFLVRRDLSKPEALMAVRLVVILEASYWLSFLFAIRNAWFTDISGLLENNLPVIVESILLPLVLIILFFNLTPKKAETGGVKWGLISGAVYVLVIWLNNAGNWVAAEMLKGIEYLTLYPANLFSFALTLVGLFLLTVYVAYLAKKPKAVKLRRVGLAVTAFGLYFDLVYVMYLVLGPVGGWGLWYAWFTGHNLDLWLMALPFTGVPLLFQEESQTSP